MKNSYGPYEAAHSYIDRIRSSMLPFTFAMVAMPASMVSVFPSVGLLIQEGTLSPQKLVTIIILSVDIISQDNHLFNMKDGEHIRISRTYATDVEVVKVAKQCGCHECVMGLENGNDTLAGSSVGFLSGGERQQVLLFEPC